MRPFRIRTLLLLLALNPFSPTLYAGTIMATVADHPAPDAKYLFYLHGKGPQEFGLERSKEKYRDIVSAFAEKGFVVISEVRGKNTDAGTYANKVAGEVQKLLAAGIPAENISVVGYSRGGVIALMASGLINNPSVNYVVMAGCFSSKGELRAKYKDFLGNYGPKLGGRMLSIYDNADDKFGSCESFVKAATGQLVYKEIVLNSGKGHDVFHHPTENWFAPAIDWATNTHTQASREQTQE